jgi:uncharacterized protein YggE
MKRVGVGIGIVLGLVLSAGLLSALGDSSLGRSEPASAQTQSNFKAVTVSGVGRVLVSPDTAQFTLGVQIRNPDLAAAQAEATTKMNAVINSLKANGIDDAKIKTVAYNIGLEYNPQKSDASISGYVVTNLVQSRIKPIDKTGAIIDAAVKAGANNVSEVSFIVEDVDAATRQARQQAMDDAKAKADQLARLGGVTLGMPVQITETNSPAPMPVDATRSVATAGGAADMAPPIQGGQSEIVVYVTVSYGI